MSALPHEGVYARIARSDIAGVGVVAIRDIPAGTKLFANDRVEIVWIERDALDWRNLSPGERSLYDDFTIRSDGKLGCPVTFNSLTIGWHCNEPPAGTEPNIAVDAKMNFLARRDIATGEELTIDYSELTASQS